ncbi:MAG: hypothetical protein NZ900_00745 [Synergistetes bacterium]|nr:hypothetical protein [Synergistota bacterium]MDW8191455.1 hypothetical protein [Synergistota bacterium]
MGFEERTNLVSLIALKLKDYRSPLITLFCKGSKEKGLGHVYRSIYIARDLWREGIKTAFNTKLAESSGVVIDLPSKEEVLEILGSLKDRKFVVLFDNDGTMNNFEVDVLVYPDFIFSSYMSFKAKEVLTGWDYVYPPLEIRRLKGLPPRGRDILVTFGGADPRKFTRQFLHLIQENPIKENINVHIIFGPLNSDYSIFSKTSLPSNIKLYKSLKDLAFLYECSSIVISSGGLSFAYSVFLERFTIGIPQSGMEERRIKFYFDNFNFVKLAYSVDDAMKEVLKILENSQS